MAFEQSPIETVTLPPGARFCATPDCDHIADVAVFRRGNKIITLECMHCYWTDLQTEIPVSDRPQAVAVQASPDPA